MLCRLSGDHLARGVFLHRHLGNHSHRLQVSRGLVNHLYLRLLAAWWLHRLSNRRYESVLAFKLVRGAISLWLLHNDFDSP